MNQGPDPGESSTTTDSTGAGPHASSGGLWRGLWRVYQRSLSNRLTGLVLVALLLVVGPAAVFEFYNVGRTVVAAHAEKWDLFEGVLHSAINHAMIDGRAEVVRSFVDEYRGLPGLLELSVFGPDGQRAFEDRVGRVVDDQLLARLVREGRFQVFEESQGQRTLVTYNLLENETRCHECHDSQDRLRGGVKVRTSLAAAQTEIADLLAIRAAAGVFVVLGLVLILRLGVARGLARAVGRLVAAATNMARGDLAAPIQVASADELGRLAAAIDAMRRGLIRITGQVKTSVLTLRAVATQFFASVDDLNAGADHQAQDAVDIARSVRVSDSVVDEITTAVHDLHRAASSAIRTIQQMKQSVEGIAGNTASYARFVDDTAASVHESVAYHATIAKGIEGSRGEVVRTSGVAARIEQSVGNVQRAAQESARLASLVHAGISDEGLVSIQDAARCMEEIRTAAANTAEVVSRMDRSSQMIDDVALVIDSVARETALLALNAAILAAKAGEEGKGFSVVAQEIRTLASRTAQNAKTIAVTVGEVKGLVGNVGHSQQDTLQVIDRGGERIAAAVETLTRILDAARTSSTQAAFIENATTEQVNAVQEINRAIKAIQSRLEEMGGASEQRRAEGQRLLAGVETVKSTSQSLKASTAQSATDADSIRRASDHILAQVERVKHSVEQLKQVSADISGRVQTIARVAVDHRALAHDLKGAAGNIDDSVRALQREVDAFKS